MSKNHIILKAQGVSKQYRLGLVGTGTLSDDLKRWWYLVRGKEDPFLKIGDSNDRSKKGDTSYVWALKDINFEVKRGEVLGIIGKNGAGKSTLLKILSKVTTPTTGEIKTKGRIASLLEVGTGFHPEMTGRENIYLNGAILGMTKSEIKAKEEEIIDFSGCAGYIDTPVKRYSSGMRVRLAFAVAAHLEPDILVIDEVLAVGDAEFQKKAIGKMQDISKGDGRTVLFVSHNMAAVKNLCTRGIVLEHGKVVFEGTADASVDFYLEKENERSALNGKFVPSQKLSEELTLHSISLTNKNDEVASVFSSEEKIKITIEYSLNKSLEDFRINIKITGKDEVDVFTTTSHDADLTNKNKGKYTAKLSLPDNFFNHGTYNVVISAGIPNYKVLIEPIKALSFNIEKVTKSGSAINVVFPGITAPMLNWQIKEH